MPNDLAHWKPAATPTPNPLAGRCVTLEPLNASRHSSDLFAAVTRHDDLWTWLAAAPTATAAEMIDKLEKWRDAERALLFAIVPANTGKAAGTMAKSRADRKSTRLNSSHSSISYA